VTDHGRFTVPELLAIADAIDPRYRMLVILSAFCGGFRFAEMAGLRASNVTFTDDGAIVNITEQYSDGKWSTPKNAASIRPVFVPPPLCNELANHLQTYPASETLEGTVFSSPTGAPLNYNNYLNRVWRPTLESLGLKPCGTHALRRSFVDICYDAKVAPEVVADIGGWADVGVITNIYRGKSTPAKIAEAAKMINAATSVYFDPASDSLIIAKGQHTDGRIDHLAVLPPDFTDEDFNTAVNG
jgi:integrase